MSYFEGDSDDDKKFKGSDDESETETIISEDEESEIGEPEIYGGAEDVEEDENYVSEEENEEEEKGEGNIDEDDEFIVEKKDLNKAEKRTKKIPSKQEAIKKPLIELSDDDTDDDETGEGYLQKFDKEINDNYLVNFHPECV